MTSETVSDLVARAQRGDGHATEAVLVAVGDDVHRLALRMTGCPDDALDAAREILVKVLTRMHARPADLPGPRVAGRLRVRLGLGLASAEGAWICETSETTYRKRLSRARAAVRAFVAEHCGLVAPAVRYRLVTPPE